MKNTDNVMFKYYVLKDEAREKVEKLGYKTVDFKHYIKYIEGPPVLGFETFLSEGQKYICIDYGKINGEEQEIIFILADEFHSYTSQTADARIVKNYIRDLIENDYVELKEFNPLVWNLKKEK